MVRETAAAAKRLKRVDVFDARPEPVIERMQKCLPKPPDVTFEAFEVPTNDIESAWLMDRACAT